jgi:hypothetical protein
MAGDVGDFEPHRPSQELGPVRAALAVWRGALVWGNPIAPPSPGATDAEIEAVRLAARSEMNRIARRPIISPACADRARGAARRRAEQEPEAARRHVSFSPAL